jgi:hypothetical protein
LLAAVEVVVDTVEVAELVVIENLQVQQQEVIPFLQ